MAEHQKFHYRSLSELTGAIQSLGLLLPAPGELSVLGEPVRLGRRTLPNRLVVHPMEGCDAAEDGSPGELTLRRYLRWATGGAGLIWFEATAVVPEGRANPRQLWLHSGSVEGFAKLLAQVRQAAGEAGCRPVIIIQLTHSGRYSRPEGRPAPIIAQHNPYLDAAQGIGPGHPLISDEALDALPEAYARAAALACQAGFDGVDIKACHRYLVNELLAGHGRGGRYGGGYDNRTRLLRGIVRRVGVTAGERMEICCRLNIYDGLPHPYGWGVGRSQAAPEGAPAGATAGGVGVAGLGGAMPAVEMDSSEPLLVVGQLLQAGLAGLSATGGNPYFRPHINRPADGFEPTAPPAEEHPLEGVARLAGLARRVQQAYPSLPVVGAGWSWLRQWGPALGAGAIRRGWASLFGLGRGALAYPDFARDILGGGLAEAKTCIACGRCSQMMRCGGPAGCVVRDGEVYGPIFQRQKLR